MAAVAITPFSRISSKFTGFLLFGYLEQGANILIADAFFVALLQILQGLGKKFWLVAPGGGHSAAKPQVLGRYVDAEPGLVVAGLHPGAARFHLEAGRHGWQ